MIESNCINSTWLGEIDFDHGLRIQQKAHEDVMAGGRGVILGLEHSKVITLGKRGRIEADLKATPHKLHEQGWQIRTIDRGGQATLHEAGQLVVYPILKWADYGLSPRQYIQLLLSITESALKSVGAIVHMDLPRGGVFCSEGKIAFCGLRLDQGVSRHGLSINIRNSSSSFAFIRPCGHELDPVTSLQELGIEQTPQEFFKIWLACLLNQIPHPAGFAPRKTLLEEQGSSNLATFVRSLGVVGSAFP